MVGKEWEATLQAITDEDSYAWTQFSLISIGYYLKFNPFLAFVGYTIELVRSIMTFMNIQVRSGIYEFLLDKTNYPDDASYLAMIEEYSKNFAYTDYSQILAGAGLSASILLFPLDVAFWNPFNLGVVATVLTMPF